MRLRKKKCKHPHLLLHTYSGPQTAEYWNTLHGTCLGCSATIAFYIGVIFKFPNPDLVVQKIMLANGYRHVGGNEFEAVDSLTVVT